VLSSSINSGQALRQAQDEPVEASAGEDPSNILGQRMVMKHYFFNGAGD
jgi:hypothetical protein